MRESYFDLSEKELAKKSKLTEKESIAVEAFKRAVRNLPRSICISVDKSGVSISKRVAKKRGARGCKDSEVIAGILI